MLVYVSDELFAVKQFEGENKKRLREVLSPGDIAPGDYNQSASILFFFLHSSENKYLNAAFQLRRNLSHFYLSPPFVPYFLESFRIFDHTFLQGNKHWKSIIGRCLSFSQN